MDEEWSPERIAGVDPAMRQYFSQREQVEFQLAKYKQTYGEKSRFVEGAQRDLDFINKRIENYAAAWRKRFAGVGVDQNGQGQLVVSESVEALKRRVETLQKQFDTVRAETEAMGKVRMDIQSRQLEVQQLTDQLKDLSDKIDQLKMEQTLSGKLRIVSYGGKTTVPISDKRIQLAVAGVVLGGGFPIALLMLVGAMDARYRYSDDAGTDISGIPLLGILPNLPDLLTDPEQAATAAHCVHQIRTMLQINADAQDRRAFALTSPSPGDGKTSLTLALGLSFAASGSRTLLIDCDLVGAGLTARMNVKNPEGILEAIAARSLMPYVQATDVADLSMLPVGAAQAHHSSLLSPGALRRLVAEARKNFDTVLIDTGPILGSIEASPVCASSDAVIVCVARGQQRPIVEKSLSHLMAIGARLAGVVFNRAQARDFEQSVSRMSMRSLARTNGNGTNGHRGEAEPRFGPVARAVAKSVSPAEGADQS
jgi:capsular exopolysaccharide synthesis family protein